jgi:hypothetical protein
LITWVRSGSEGGLEYALPHTGASITRLNSGNGVLPIDDPKNVETKKKAAKSGSLLGFRSETGRTADTPHMTLRFFSFDVAMLAAQVCDTGYGQVCYRGNRF